MKWWNRQWKQLQEEKKEAGNKEGLLWGWRGGEDCHQEPPQWFEERHFAAFNPSNYSGILFCKSIVKQRKPPTAFKMRNKDLFGGQTPSPCKTKQSFYLMLWLVEHSWHVAVLTINSFWGFQMPQLCFSVFNHLQKLFIALYTSLIMTIIL